MRKQYRLLSSLLALVLLFASLAPVVLADSGNLGGSFAIGDNAPGMGTPISASATSWDPTSQYSVTVPVEDQDKMKDVSLVVLTIVRDGYAGAADPTSKVVLRWTRVGNSQNGDLAIDGAGSGSYPWSLDNVDVPPAGQTAGEWVLHFTVGDVAREGLWHVSASVTSGGQVANNGPIDVTVNWYGRIKVNTPSVAWGQLNGGSSDNASGNVSVSYVANGDYRVAMNASGTWNGLDGNSATLISSGAPTGTQIALHGNVIGDRASAQQLGTAAVTVDNTGIATDQSGNTVETNKLWLDLGGGFAKDTYNGTITFVMGNR